MGGKRVSIAQPVLAVAFPCGIWDGLTGVGGRII